MFLCVEFYSDQTGLATVGYRLFDADGTPNGARSTSGVIELGNGEYGADVTVPFGFNGYIEWDTGETPTPTYRRAPVMYAEPTPNGFADWTAPLTAAEVNAEVDAALTDYDGPTKAELDTGLSSLQSHGDAEWSTFDGGAVASVTGDVGGKVLGGGSGTISGTGVWADARAVGGTATSYTGGNAVISFRDYVGTGTAPVAVDGSGRVTLQADQSGVTVGTTKTLTNLPSIPNNWLTAAGIASGALDGKGDWLTLTDATTNLATAAALAVVDGNVDSILEDTATTIPGLIGDLPTAAENATAWGVRVLGNGRTADYFLKGAFNKTVRTATKFTVYDTDDTTVIASATATQDGTLNPLASVDP